MQKDLEKVLRWYYCLVLSTLGLLTLIWASVMAEIWVQFGEDDILDRLNTTRGNGL